MRNLNYLISVVVICAYMTYGFPEFCVRVRTDRMRTEVEYFGNLTCTVRDNFCAYIFYVEHDHLSFNEDASFVPFRCTKNGTLSHHIFVDYRNGDGGDDFYEPMIRIIHDCVSLPKTKFAPYGHMGAFDFRLQDVDIHYNVDWFNYTVDISDRGLMMDTLNDSNKRFLNWIGDDTPQAKAWIQSRKQSMFYMYDEDERYC